MFSAHSLTCIRGDRPVFSRVGFSLSPGDALLLVGRNGAGKSSLLRLMAGLLRPAAGAVTWDGVPIDQDPEAHGRRMRYVGHLEAVKPVLSTFENVRFWAAINRLGQRRRDIQGDSAIDAAVDAALHQMDLSHLRETPGRMLSAGQKKRVALARLIAAPATLWLLDEPTVALDRASVGTLTEAIAAHRACGGIVVISTHLEIDAPGASTLEMDRFRAAPLEISDDAQLAEDQW